MLTTSYKSKIGKAWSYPLGLKDIESAFAGLPILERFDISFSDQYDKKAPLYDVLELRYSGFSYKGQPFRHGWRIWVRSIPRPFRHKIKSELIESILPNQIRPWLVEHASIDGRLGSALFSIMANRLDGTLICNGYDPEIEPARS